ncbi:MAG: GNAT family N-acetyltransferase [Nanoarchaeota archaeon]
MGIQSRDVGATGIKLYVTDEGKEIARAYLYFLSNDLHTRPFGLMEDVFVDSSQRGSGIGTRLTQRVIQEARDRGCYKLICTSRHEKPEVHRLYLRLGFKDHGKEFRIDFS